MIKDYYKILGVSHKASEHSIKSSYRELALRYHPDRNRNERAHDIFTEINEAYQVLSDATKKADYDYKYRKYILDEETYPEEKPSPHTYQPAQFNKEDFETEEQFSENTYSFIKRTAYIALVLSGFLLIDFYLPPRISKEHLYSSNLKYEYERYNRRTEKKERHLENYDVIRTENYYVFYQDPPYYMSLGDTIIIHSSRILDVPVKVFHEKDKKLTVVPTEFGLYDLYVAYIVMLLISLLSIIIIENKISATQTLTFFWFVNLLIFGWIFLVIFIYYNLKYLK
jgi:curved DNA-binding protein CbpA